MSVLQVRRAVAASTLALALGLLAACGGSDNGTAASTSSATSASSSSASSPSSASSSSSSAAPSSSSSASAAAQAQTVAVTEADFTIQLPSTDLPAGAYTFTVANKGHATHDLVVEQNGSDVAKSDIIGPGDNTTLTVTLQPGKYVFYCSVGNHRAMGMETDVTVS